MGKGSLKRKGPYVAMLMHVYSSQSTTSSQVGSGPTDEYVDYCPYWSQNFELSLLRRRGGVALGLRGATGNGCFVGVGSRGAFEENRPDRSVFVGVTVMVGVLATAAYDFVAFLDVGGGAVSVGGLGQSAQVVDMVLSVAVLVLYPVSAWAV